GAHRAVVARGDADDGAELAGEGAVVGVAAGLRDRGDAVGAVEEAGGALEPELDQEAVGRELEHAIELALELRHRELGDAGEVGDADVVGEVAVEVVYDGGEARVERRA